MDKAEQLFEALLAKRTQLGRNPTKEEWLGVAREVIKVKRKKTDMTDAEWFESLKSDPALSGINIDVEWGRACFWYKQNVSKTGQPSRQRFTNWLLKAERTVSLKAAGATYASGLKLPPPDGPEGWIEWLETELFKLSPDDSAYGQITFAHINRKFDAMPKSWQDRCKTQLTKTA